MSEKAMSEKATRAEQRACCWFDPSDCPISFENLVADFQAAADEARAEERKWVREQVAELKKVSGWKCELIERMDAREASDE